MEQELNEYLDSDGLTLPLKNRWLFMESKGLVRNVLTRFGYKEICITEKGMEFVNDDKGNKVTNQYAKTMSDIDRIMWNKNKHLPKLDFKSYLLSKMVNKIDYKEITNIKKNVEETIDAESVPF